MTYTALATDYDGTVAHDGVLDAPTLAALDRLRAAGVTLVMVTGRELDDLLAVCPHLDHFALVVAENGAVVYRPATGGSTLLAPHPPDVLADELRRRGVPVSVGRSIVATVEPHQSVVLDVIRELGLEWHIIFNKGAVMCLPSGVNKATGLTAALDELRIDARHVVGVGDAENDHAFLAMCGLAVAVGNALQSVKDAADLVTAGKRGEGVAELVGHWLADGLPAPGRAGPVAEA